jgi:hypothetical protein
MSCGQQGPIQGWELLCDLTGITGYCENNRTLPQIPLWPRVPPVNQPLCPDLATEFQEHASIDTFPRLQLHIRTSTPTQTHSLEDHIQGNAATARRLNIGQAAWKYESSLLPLRVAGTVPTWGGSSWLTTWGRSYGKWKLDISWMEGHRWS